MSILISVLKRFFSLFNVISLLVLAVSAYAYQVMQKPPAVPKLPPLKLSENSAVELKIYYPDNMLDRMRPIRRRLKVTSKDRSRLAQAAINAWAKGPGMKGSGALEVLPSKAQIPQVYLRGQHFIVNLPSNYTKLNYGSSAERMLICTLTRTLLDISGKDVYFLLGGKSVDALRHIDLREPFTAQDCPIK